MAALARALRALRPGGARGGSGAAAAAPPHGAAGGYGSPAVPSSLAARAAASERLEDGMWAARRTNPDWHGFSEDAAADAFNMRATFVAGVSVAIVLGSVFLHYLPDYGLQQWARREAERQIRAREAQGLPLLTPRYYDPARLPLPPPED